MAKEKQKYAQHTHERNVAYARNESTALSVPICREAHKSSRALCADLSHRISHKPDSKCGKWDRN